MLAGQPKHAGAQLTHLCSASVQVVNATKGLTFSSTPEFEYNLLAQDTGDVEQLRADSQSTTYDAVAIKE
jgi:hypothetical protein